VAIGWNRRRLINKVTKKMYRVTWIDGQDVYLEGSDLETLSITTSELIAQYEPHSRSPVTLAQGEPGTG
jgi:hypothetical protein